MPEFIETMVQYPGQGVTIHAFMVGTKGAQKRPALIVVQEWWGLNEHIKDVARRWAHEGYVTIAPDLYSRLGHAVTSSSHEAGKLMNTLRQEDGLKDLTTTVSYLKTLPEVDADRIGVTGFCMGGSYALMLPCITAGIKAAVPFYGQVPNPETPLQHLGCPILYIYGEDDGWITRADVRRLAEALKKYNKVGDIKTYPGAAHAFFNDTRKDVYKPAEAKDAWGRAVSFFGHHLNA